ncbi:MAG: osmotically inducible protein OsmC [Bacteroidetes bacterium]|nr:osmotically inducible protein OsmC [Bacteroidota bacterium]
MEITFDGNKVITAHLNEHIIRTDQPVNAGGENSAPTPFDLFMAAIGTCAGIYVKMFCDQRNINSENIRIIQKAEYDRQTGLPSFIKIDIQLPADFPEKYKTAVINAAELCKVKRTIANPPKFEVITSVK